MKLRLTYKLTAIFSWKLLHAELRDWHYCTEWWRCLRIGGLEHRSLMLVRFPSPFPRCISLKSGITGRLLLVSMLETRMQELSIELQVYLSVSGKALC